MIRRGCQSPAESLRAVGGGVGRKREAKSKRCASSSSHVLGGCSFPSLLEFSIPVFASTIEPLPEGTYSTLDATMAAVQEFAITQGYSVVKRRTTENSKIDGQWHLKVKNAEHNHEPSFDMSGHPRVRRLNQNQQAAVRQMFVAGVPPQSTLTTLRQADPDLSAIARNIYNERATARRESLRGRTPIEAILDEFREVKYYYDHHSDTENHIIQLFWAHPLSIRLAKTYSTVIQMDCTYKTNTFRMPMLHVVGMTPFNNLPIRNQ
nr:protein FAR1-RELATED SEQUENCE 5-like [Physcomitrium patens]|eukprot:XP_024375781.1 protein FAR1-RELATED SEQUENCE 5-like [Physcomitrella patens]